MPADHRAGSAQLGPEGGENRDAPPAAGVQGSIATEAAISDHRPARCREGRTTHRRAGNRRLLGLVYAEVAVVRDKPGFAIGIRPLSYPGSRAPRRPLDARRVGGKRAAGPGAPAIERPIYGSAALLRRPLLSLSLTLSRPVSWMRPRPPMRWGRSDQRALLSGVRIIAGYACQQLRISGNRSAPKADCRPFGTGHPKAALAGSPTLRPVGPARCSESRNIPQNK